MTKRRQTIARRLVEAQHTAAMLTTFNEVDMSAVMALRERRKESFKKEFGVGLGIASFFVKSAIAALRAFPALNAEVQGDEILFKHYYDVGVAVGAEGGLVVPVIRDADRLSFPQIELAIRDFATRAADGTLTLEDLRGGTFTVTNGGVFGSLMSTPILNPPQVGILGLHKIQDRVIPVNGQVAIRPMMYVALSYDHRIVDGREAVQFLAKIKDFVEDPGQTLAGRMISTLHAQFRSRVSFVLIAVRARSGPASPRRLTCCQPAKWPSLPTVKRAPPASSRNWCARQQH